ncbi:hypothetical protein CN155_04865 [Sinorhizobium meliloti]|uniref:hypothetical protein n=1 Tax=Rhizobium meliloti TaxID=382 RepID=UPI000FDC5AF4|nr:hypothetical protein [Sinorhizobium meliloti]RVK60594.1 hypothetical protein CN155_04865 [Sinorhizobium meliloti]
MSRYAPYSVVSKVSKSGRSFSGALHIYTKEEASSQFEFFVHQVEAVLTPLFEFLPVNGEVYFAFVGDGQPYKASLLDKDIFVILIDVRALDYLFTFAARLQVIGPLAARFGAQRVEPTKNYEGQYLLDIAKDVIFHPELVLESCQANSSNIISLSLLAYVIAHEYAHIAHGHLDLFASAHFQKFALDEADRDLTFRTLEMDADASAATSTHTLFEGFWKSEIAPKLTAEEQVERSALYRLRYLIGITLAHIYLDSLAGPEVPNKHPVTYFRYSAFLSVLRSVITSRGDFEPIVLEEARLLVVNTFAHLSGAASDLGHPIAANIQITEREDRLRTEYSSIGEAMALEEMAQYGGRWSKLYPYLANYLRGGRLAPPYAEPL